MVTRSVAGGAITRQVNYTYDVHDQRIAKVVDLDGAGAGAPTTERFVYDRGQIAMVFSNGATTPTQRYLYGTDVDQVLAEQQGTSTTTWALTDHQGTVRDLIDNTGTNRNRIRYDSFGNITNQTNPALTFRFGYTGRDFDSETGLSYYRARYYDARVGRFLSEDPIGFEGGDANLYRYVGNSPANYTDPSGRIAIAPILIGGGLLPLLFDGLWSPVQAPTSCGDVHPGLPWYYRIPLETAIGAVFGAAPGIVDDLAGSLDDIGRSIGSSFDDWFGQGPTLAPAGGGSFGRGGRSGQGG